MKPVSLRFRCFGSYMSEQYIDFTQLEKSGLFLICGDTGSGKTTILDAICYALYGRSSGGLRGDISVMRCKLAQKEDETLTEFIFDVGHNRYKFTRSLKYGRKKLNDSHNCLIEKDGQFVPLFENPKATVVNQKAQDLIGLTYDQFRQVIILPQGQFERLLVSDSVEKEKILVSLFHADRWQQVADEIYRRTAQRDTDLKQEKLRMEEALRRHRCDNLAQLEERCAQEMESLTQIRDQAREARVSESICRRAHEEGLLLQQSFQELRRREQTLLQLKNQERAWQEEESILRNADAAEAIRREYQACRLSEAALKKTESALAQAQIRVKNADAALEQARESRDLLETKRPQTEYLRTRMVLLENARDIYARLEQNAHTASMAEAALNAARREESLAQEDFTLRDRQWRSAMDRQTQAMAEYQAAQQQYLHSIGAVLAEKLLPGSPCPVCGSIEHPAPARSTGEVLSEQQLEEKNRALTRASGSVTTAMGKRTEAETRLRRTQEEAHRAMQTKALADSELDRARQQRIEGIENERQLERELIQCRTGLEDFRREEALCQQTLTAAQAAHTAAGESCAAAREALTAAAETARQDRLAWEQALAQSGLGSESYYLTCEMTPEEKQRRSNEAARFRASFQQAKEALLQQQTLLTGQTPPDTAALETNLTQARTQTNLLHRQQILAEQTLETMSRDARELAKRQEDYLQQRQEVDADLDFANRLRGRSGVSLQRYVLGVMLTSVTTEANRLLGGVYGGRYKLFRTDEISGAGHKGGLELEVYDSHNNQRRSVTTLSGGEKFLVALSLAIGLSTVVQAQGQGIRLEAMFIDEGFGSLDREAVTDALEVLQGMHCGSGVVGIISHVEQLAQIIPTRIEIRKGRNGSTLTVRN